MSITQHYFLNKTESYAEAKYQARVLFHLYEKGTIKLFSGWFKTYEGGEEDSIISARQFQVLFESYSEDKALHQYIREKQHDSDLDIYAEFDKIAQEYWEIDNKNKKK